MNLKRKLKMKDSDKSNKEGIFVCNDKSEWILDGPRALKQGDKYILKNGKIVRIDSSNRGLVAVVATPIGLSGIDYLRSLAHGTTFNYDDSVFTVVRTREGLGLLDMDGQVTLVEDLQNTSQPDWSVINDKNIYWSDNLEDIIGYSYACYND